MVRSMFKSFSFLVFALIAITFSMSGASAPALVGDLSSLVIVKPPVVLVGSSGQAMALLGDCDTPLSKFGISSSDQTPLLAQRDKVLRKDYPQTIEWSGVSKLHPRSRK